MSDRGVEHWGLFLFGLALTSASLSSGFIWACGQSCVSRPLVWSEATRPLLVFGAGFAAWWGYLIAHYGSTEEFVDESAHDAEEVHEDTGSPDSLPVPPLVGVVFGVGVLVLGMVIGVIYIRQGNHLITNVGGAFFLGGFVVAHYFETGVPL